MVESGTDTLDKPDMQAVLTRTHIGKDLHSLMLPVFEAISNAMHGIEEKFGEAAKLHGEIDVAFEHPHDPAKIKISVTDNGIGLTDTNYNSFKTPFSGYKLKRRGRGFGRFIAFKIFGRVRYFSRYEFFAEQKLRVFQFDVKREQEFRFLDEEPAFQDSGVCVEYDQPLLDWHSLIGSLSFDDVADEIGNHFLPQFLYKWLPKITIRFGTEPPVDITSRFKEIFVRHDAGTFQCEIDGEGETLNYALTRIPKTRSFKNHCLLLSAAERIVGSPRDLTNKLGTPHFANEKDERYIVLAVVSGDAFETRLNDARTSINLQPKVIEQIVSSVTDAIQKKEATQIEKIKTRQSTDLTEALKENPILRLGLRGRTVNDYVSSKPNHWKAEEFVSDLAIERFRASHDLTKAITTAASNAENYEETLKTLVDQLDESKKQALAEYVIHRRNIISLVESARRFSSDGNRAPEDAIHDLVFKRFSDSVSVDYFEHNLWLVDDALAFLPYVSSDRTIHGGKRKTGDKVADLAFFDDSLVLGDNDGTTVTIIEFKKPSRNDYSFGAPKKDPVLQVIETLEQATRAGGITKTDGAHFSFAGAVRRFAYIVADLTPTLVNVLDRHDFKNDWNPKIYFRFRDKEKIFIQAFGYDTLIENAKKRNQAFFTVLLGE
jgi:hypothetical protein